MEEAARNGDLKKVEQLLKQGVDPNAGIRWAIRNGHIHVAKLLLDSGAKLDGFGIGCAVFRGYISVVRFVLMYDVDPNNYIGLASSRGHINIVELLLAAGADPFIATKNFPVRTLALITKAQNKARCLAFLHMSLGNTSRMFFDQAHFDANVIPIIFTFMKN